MNVSGHHYSMPTMVLCGFVVFGGAIAVGFFGFGVAPWFILMGAFCILMMGSMLWMMVGMGGHAAGQSMGSHTDNGGVVASGRSASSKESAIEILERRFAEGAVTPENYRARREVLVGQAERGGHPEESD